MRAQIADILWLRRHGCKRGYNFAILAYDSYMEYINQESFTFWMGARLERALQFAMLLNDRKRLGKALGVAKEIANNQLAAGEVATWSRMTGLLARYSKNDRDKYAEQIWQQAAEVEETGKLDFAIRLREQAIDLFTKNNTSRIKEARLELVEILITSAERKSSSSNDWRVFRKAQSLIEKAISHHKLASGTKQCLDMMFRLHTEYGKKTLENMEVHETNIELPQEELATLNVIADNVAEKFKDKPLEESLVTLAVGLRSIDVDAAKNEAEQRLRVGGLASLVDFREVNHEGKTIGREGPFTAAWYTMIQRVFHVGIFIRPAIFQILKDHDVQLEDIAKLLERSDFVPQHSRWTFAYGLMAGLRPQFDFVAVAHVLPPMLENALREILAINDKSTSWLDSEFISKERPLGWVLEQSETEHILGADLLFDLKTLLLAKEGGFNLRNEVAHGLMVDGNFFQSEGGENSHQLAQIMYLWWLALRLCFAIRRTDRAE